MKQYLLFQSIRQIPRHVIMIERGMNGIVKSSNRTAMARQISEPLGFVVISPAL